jgi:hypothetical protein
VGSQIAIEVGDLDPSIAAGKSHVTGQAMRLNATIFGACVYFPAARHVDIDINPTAVDAK